MNERRKISYIIWRIINARDEIFYAWDEGHFEDAEDIIISFIENSAEAYEAWIEREETEVSTEPDERRAQFLLWLKDWEITNDTARH